MNTTSPFHDAHYTIESRLYSIFGKLNNVELTSLEMTRRCLKELKSVVPLVERANVLKEVHFLSLLAEYEPGVADTFKGHHLKCKQQGQKLLTDITSSLQDNTLFNPVKFFKQFGLYKVFVENCFLIEENVLPPILYRYYSNETLELIQNKWARDFRLGLTYSSTNTIYQNADKKLFVLP